MNKLFYFYSPEGKNSRLEKAGNLFVDLGTQLGIISKKIQEEDDPNQKELLKREFTKKQEHLNTMFKLTKSQKSPGIK